MISFTSKSDTRFGSLNAALTTPTDDLGALLRRADRSRLMSRIATSRPQRSVSRDRRHSLARGLPVIATVAIVVLLAGSLVLGGMDALAGAVVGLALVTVFLLAGRLPFLVDAQLGAGAAFIVLGVNYLFRVVLLVVALAALHDQTWLDPRVVGLVVIAGALSWNAVALRRHLLAGNVAATPETAEQRPVDEQHLERPADPTAVSATTGGGDR